VSEMVENVMNEVHVEAFGSRSLLLPVSRWCLLIVLACLWQLLVAGPLESRIRLPKCR